MQSIDTLLFLWVEVGDFVKRNEKNVKKFGYTEKAAHTEKIIPKMVGERFINS